MTNLLVSLRFKIYRCLIMHMHMCLIHTNIYICKHANIHKYVRVKSKGTGIMLEAAFYTAIYCHFNFHTIL